MTLTPVPHTGQVSGVPGPWLTVLPGPAFAHQGLPLTEGLLFLMTEALGSDRSEPTFMLCDLRCMTRPL